MKPSTPPVQQPLDLARERVARLGHRRLAERLDAHAERTDGADHGRAGAGGLARERRGRGVDPLGLVGKAIGRELDGIRAEGVRLDELGAGPHVFAVDVPHEIRLLEVELVVADVQENAATVEHRPHRPVGHMDPTICQQLAQSRHVTARSGDWVQATAPSSATSSPFLRA